MVRIAQGEIVALAAAVAALLAGKSALHWSRNKTDPRGAIVRKIRSEASNTRDIVVLTDEATELVAAAAPVPAVYGTPVLDALFGFRRLYVVALAESSLVQFEARLGVPTVSLGFGARRWDLDGIATVRFNLAKQLTESATARREGGPHSGPCVRVGPQLRCHSPDAWNHVGTTEHSLNGATVHCVGAHPQAESLLIIEVPEIPPARALVGIVGIDDRAYFSQGAPVRNHIRFQARGGGPPVERDVVTPNQRGIVPYRLDLGDKPGSVSFTITTPNAAARNYCFTAYVTE